MLQRDREQSPSLSKWINMIKAGAAKLKISGPQVRICSNVCGKCSAGRPALLLREVMLGERSASRVGKVTPA